MPPAVASRICQSGQYASDCGAYISNILCARDKRDASTNIGVAGNSDNEVVNRANKKKNRFARDKTFLPPCVTLSSITLVEREKERERRKIKVRSTRHCNLRTHVAATIYPRKGEARARARLVLIYIMIAETESRGDSFAPSFDSLALWRKRFSVCRGL